MPLNRTEIISVIRQLCENREITVTVSGSAKGAFTAGICAFGGGLIGGPIGLGIGGTIGSIYAAWSSSGTFKSVAAVIQEDMTEEQRERLARSVENIVRQIEVTDVAMLLSYVYGNADLQSLIIKEIALFLKNELGMAISY